MKNKQNYENTFLEKKYDTQKVKSYKEVVIRAESKFQVGNEMVLACI